MRPVIITILAASTLAAQFNDLAVTGNEDIRSRIYIIAGDKIELSATGGGTDPFGPGAILPLTSGDGSTTSYALIYPCRTGICGLSGIPRTFFQLPGLPIYAFSSLQISRSGRFLLGSIFNLRPTLIEFPSFATTQIPDIYYSTGPWSLANDGTILLRDFRNISTSPLAARLPG